MGIQIYLKYKYTNENAGFYILCIDDFKYNYKFSRTVGISRDFSPRNVTGKTSPAPNVNMTLINSWIFTQYLVSDAYKVTGHDRSRSSENRHCALDISPNFYQIFTKGSSVHVDLHKVLRLIKYNKMYEIVRKD